jgi:hypothetical protein
VKLEDLTYDDLLSLTYAQGGKECHTFWGSHACDRPVGHEMPHVCGRPDSDDNCLCSAHDGTQVRIVMQDDSLSESRDMPLLP